MEAANAEMSVVTDKLKGKAEKIDAIEADAKSAPVAAKEAPKAEAKKEAPKPEEEQKKVKIDAAQEAPKAESKKEAPNPEEKKEKKEEKEVKIDAAKEAPKAEAKKEAPKPETEEVPKSEPKKVAPKPAAKEATTERSPRMQLYWGETPLSLRGLVRAARNDVLSPMASLPGKVVKQVLRPFPLPVAFVWGGSKSRSESTEAAELPAAEVEKEEKVPLTPLQALDEARLRRKREFLENCRRLGLKEPVGALAAFLLLWRMPAALRAAEQSDAPSAKDVAKELVRNVVQAAANAPAAAVSAVTNFPGVKLYWGETELALGELVRPITGLPSKVVKQVLRPLPLKLPLKFPAAAPAMSAKDSTEKGELSALAEEAEHAVRALAKAADDLEKKAKEAREKADKLAKLSLRKQTDLSNVSK